MRPDDSASELLAKLLRPHGCREAGVALGAAGQRHAGPTPAGTERTIPLDGMPSLRISHDEREAPVVLGNDGGWDDTTLVSLSDEGTLAACAWARPQADSPIVGIGIDLADPKDFDGKRGERFNPLIFTQREHELVPRLCADDPALAYAYAFSAKEAAFKACAAPLRRWYRDHDEELLFDIRGFELADPRHERGTARHGEAQRALDALGIESITLGRMSWGTLALTVAVALRGLTH